jgi:[acyl-carrier-protein] S-malonyltransferase
MRAFVFPGQGAQTIGMGKALAVAYPAAKEVFDEVDDALGQRLSKLIWEGDIDTLTLTANAQPALMATSLAALCALQAEGVALKTASFVAGHSLGEYSALAAVGAISIANTARLLRIRGIAMQEAANDYDPGQVVVSGQKAAVERALVLAKEAGAKRAVLLPVSAPFHCALMEPAAARMEKALSEVEVLVPILPLIANVNATAVSDPPTIKSLLIQQVTGSVRWRESIMYLAAVGVSEIWEIGAGKALSGMVRRIDRTLNCQTIGSPEDIAKVLMI